MRIAGGLVYLGKVEVVAHIEGKKNLHAIWAQTARGDLYENLTRFFSDDLVGYGMGFRLHCGLSIWWH